MGQSISSSLRSKFCRQRRVPDDVFTSVPPPAAEEEVRASNFPGQPYNVAGDGPSELRARLAGRGIDVSKYGVAGANSLSDLSREVRGGLCEINDEPDVKRGLLRTVSLIEISLLASTREGDLVLTSTEQVLGDGRCRKRRQRIVLKLRAGESENHTWRAGLQRALRERLGLRAKECDLIRVDEASHIVTTSEKISASYPGLFTKYRCHSVTVYMPDDTGPNAAKFRAAMGLVDAVDELKASKLSSNDVPASHKHFMSVEGHFHNTVGANGNGSSGGARVHLWTWESVVIHETSKFASKLQSFNVPTDRFGSGPTNSLLDLWKEVYQFNLCELEFRKDGVKRLIDIMKIHIIVKIRGIDRHLLSTQQTFHDGTERKRRQNLVKKLQRPVDDWEESAKMVVLQRLNMEPKVFELGLFKINRDTYKVSDEPQGLDPSSGYPGIETLYKVHEVSVHVTDVMHELLKGIGLPEGNDFMTAEFVKKAGAPRLHMWTWGETQTEIEDSEATGLEKTHVGLRDLERTLQSAMDSTAGSKEDSPLVELLKTACGRVKQVRMELSNIDSLIGDVDISKLSASQSKGDQNRRETTQDEATGHKELLNFLKVECTKGKTRSLDDPADDATASKMREHNGARKMQRSSTFFDAELIRKAAEMIANGRKEELALDALAVSEQTNGKSLLVVAELSTVHLSDLMGADQETMRHYISAIQKLYIDNPYHNEQHGATVGHMTMWLMGCFPIFDDLVPWERIGMHIAAMGHDVRHFGRNNAFCVATSSELALIYNDRSVLENMHASTCFQVMVEDTGRDITKGLDKDSRNSFRSLVIDLILATDMANHFESVAKFRVRAESGDFPKAGDQEDRRLLSRTIVKAADLGHVALPGDLHKAWSLRVVCEFFSQGDDELRLGLPVSPLCDRRIGIGGLGKSQQGFIKFVCYPLFKELSVVANSQIESVCLANIDENTERWGTFETSQEEEDAVAPRTIPANVMDGSLATVYTGIRRAPLIE